MGRADLRDWEIRSACASFLFLLGCVTLGKSLAFSGTVFCKTKGWRASENDDLDRGRKNHARVIPQVFRATM